MPFRRPAPPHAALVLLFAAACASDPTGVAATPIPPGTAAVLRVRLTTPAGAAGQGADVYAGVYLAAAGDPCTRPGRLVSLTRVPASAGETVVAVPADSSASTRPRCVAALAHRRDTTAAVGEPTTLETDVDVAPLAAAGPAERAVSLALAPARPFDASREPDDTWARLARTTVPGFAGFYLDGPCTVVVRLANPASAAAARAYVTSALSGRLACPNAPTITVRAADYDFAQLRRWYDRVQILTALDGWQSTDLSESRNRLVLGYRDTTALRSAARALATLDVPAGAVVLEQEGAVAPGD